MENLIKSITILAAIYICTLKIDGRTIEATQSIFVIKLGLMVIATILTVQLIKQILTNLNK